MRVELAGYYAQDASDFFLRYKFTFYSDRIDFQGVRSWRSKAYVDLRMALEALLKSVICLRSPRGLAGKPLVRKIRNHSHDISTLMGEAFRGVALEARFSEALNKCSVAPVDLRYQFDAMNFRSGDDRDYYDTIGSDRWLKTLEEFVDVSLKRLQTALNRQSKIVPIETLFSEFNRPRDY